MKKAVLFDLDGTLWDPTDSSHYAWNQVLHKYPTSYPPFSRELIKSLFGRTTSEVCNTLFPESAEEEKKEYAAYSAMRQDEYIRQRGAAAWDGMPQMLDRVKSMGYFIAIVSNCHSGYIEGFLERFDLTELVGDLECYGSTQLPKYRNIQLVIERNDLHPVIYVGDTQPDYDAASKAGCGFIHAAMGFGQVMQDVPAVRNLAELPQAIEALVRDEI